MSRILSDSASTVPRSVVDVDAAFSVVEVVAVSRGEAVFWLALSATLVTETISRTGDLSLSSVMDAISVKRRKVP